MSTCFVRLLDELEYCKSFLFLKNEKIQDSSLKNQTIGQPSYGALKSPIHEPSKCALKILFFEIRIFEVLIIRRLAVKFFSMETVFSSKGTRWGALKCPLGIIFGGYLLKFENWKFPQIINFLSHSMTAHIILSPDTSVKMMF